MPLESAWLSLDPSRRRHTSTWNFNTASQMGRPACACALLVHLEEGGSTISQSVSSSRSHSKTPDPSRQPPNTQIGYKTHKENVLYIGYLIIVNGQNIKKKSVLKFCILVLPRVENCISRLCPSPLEATSSPLQHPNRVKNT